VQVKEEKEDQEQQQQSLTPNVPHGK